MTAKTPPAKTPTVAVTRALRRMGLTNRGPRKDFGIIGHYNRAGERLYTLVVIYSAHAARVVADCADRIEELTSEAGFSFRVSVRRIEGLSFPDVTIGNGGSVASLREWDSTADRVVELTESSWSTVTLDAILRRRTGSSSWSETGRQGVCEALVKDGVTLGMVYDLSFG